jgi:murein L,D-transpeptidase YafK
MSLRGLFSIRRGLAIAIASLALAACQYDAPKDLKPVSSALKLKMDQLGMSEIAPIYIRIFKEESEFEIWKQRADGRYALLKTYEICKWSGVLGPKKAEGDRQAPEGYYTVTPAQMNPNSSYYLSFDIGYPNAYDRALGRTGANLMVHGACSSRGCYSMTDDIAGEIFALARDAFRGGQRSFSLAAYPFRMTPENLARHRNDSNMPYWKMLKDGYDHFDVTQLPPKVDVCNKRYVFDADAGASRFNASAACPAFTVPENIRVAVAAKQQADEAAYKVALVKVEEDETRKTAEVERRKVADERTIAAAQEYEAKQAAKEAARDAAATPAKLSLAEESDAPEKKEGRFAAFKRWITGDRDKPATTASTQPMSSEFDAGAGASAATPIPVPRPGMVARTPEATPSKKEAAVKPAEAAPVQKSAAAPVEKPAPAPKPEVIVEEPQADAPEPVQAETPKAEPLAPAAPATASTSGPAKQAGPTTTPPAATPPPAEKTGKPNFDDVFG